MTKKIKFTCSRPECDIRGERYKSQIRNPDRLYCSVDCKKLDESRFQCGERNSNYKHGKYLDTTCSCGNSKDHRSVVCLSCKDYGYAADNIVKSQGPLDVFVLGTKRQNQKVIKLLRRLNLVPYVCAECDSEPSWNEKPLTLQLDHINGNPLDNRIANLRFLCPNCHSQTETWGYKNRKGGRYDYMV